MLTRISFLFIFMAFAESASSQYLSRKAQDHSYTVSNAHSHNDYEQKVPYWMAYNAGFGSIEADIFLVDSILYVAHDKAELKRKMRLDSVYLFPLINCIQKNDGHPYNEFRKKLQVLIDVKTESYGTLAALINLLNKYPYLINCKSVIFVITGNRPDPSQFSIYPEFIRFDGVLHINYSNEALSKISMMSDDFKLFSLWDGDIKWTNKDDSTLKAVVDKAHQLGKPVRFWNAPDIAKAWERFILLKADYINTDHISALAEFLGK